MIALLTIMQSEDFTTSLSGDFAKSGAQMNPRGFFNAKKKHGDFRTNNVHRTRR